MSHGSGAAVAVAVGAGTAGADGGRAVAEATEVTVGSGVLETVESPDAHPATVNAAEPIMTAHFTVAHGTAIGVVGHPGARRVGRVAGIRLCKR